MSQAAVVDTRINRCAVRVTRADITVVDLDAFVYYARPDLSLGSGFGGAISVRGGPSIQQELDELGPIATGRAVLTGAGKLKAKHIIHAVGPRFQEQDLESKLRRTVKDCLRVADENGISSLAFPAMGAGYYGIPPTVSANVLIEALASHLEGPTDLTEVEICVLDTPQLEAFEAALAVLHQGRGPGS